MAHLRDEFLLRPDVVYLNHGSFGACPRPVFAAYQELQRELEAEPVDFLHSQRSLPDRMAAARGELAAYLGVSRDDLVFVPNATTGVNIVARSLRLRPGDEVLATDHEYGAMDRTWRFVCQRSGAHYVRRELPLPLEDPAAVVERIWEGVNDRTRVLFLSHLTSPTAVILPVAALVSRARERGILTLVDGAHAPGQLPLDLAALGADFYTGNCHKWLLAPKGAAFLHARRECQDLLEPLIVSWGWHGDQPGPSRFVDEHEWTGTRDPAAYLAVPAALRFLAQHDWPQAAAQCRRLLRAARSRWLERVGLPPLCAAEPWLGQMATLPLPDGELGGWERRLRREHGIEAPLIAFGGRNWLRISIQVYNSPSDIDALLAVLDDLPV